MSLIQGEFTGFSAEQATFSEACHVKCFCGLTGKISLIQVITTTVIKTSQCVLK